MTTSVCIR